MQRACTALGSDLNGGAPVSGPVPKENPRTSALVMTPAARASAHERGGHDERYDA